MYLAAVHYPKIENKGFHAFRKKYDPYFNLMPVHISLVFPLPESVGLKEMESHIRKILEKWQPFETHFYNLQKTVDHWLMLVPDNGYNEVVLLHDELYTGILEPYLRKDLPFTPHIGLGLFSKQPYDFNNPTAQLQLNRDIYLKAVDEFESLHFEVKVLINSLTILRVDNQFSSVTDLLEIPI